MFLRSCFAAFLLAAVFLPGVVSGQKLAVADIIRGHALSLGKEGAVTEIRNLVIVGDATVKFVTGKTPEAAGRIVIASEGEKSFIGMNFNTSDYPQEAIVFDGKNVRIGAVRNNSRSVLGNFLSTNSGLVRESLLGGVLLRSWGPLASGGPKAKVELDGTKKINGRETYVLSYAMKGGGSVKVKLYFDKETFRHVRSEYSMMFSSAIGKKPDESAGFSETRLKVTEDFDDFRQEGSLMLPHKHTINYSTSGQNGTTEIEWRFNYTEMAFNQPLAADTFAE